MENVLHKPFSACTEEEIRFIFHVFAFDLKEFSHTFQKSSFEVHFQNHYIARIQIDGDMAIFTNEWVLFNINQSHSFVVKSFGCIGELVMTFVNIFAQYLVAQANYSALYNKEWSVFASEDEAHSYLSKAQEIIVNIQNTKNTKIC